MRQLDEIKEALELPFIIFVGILISIIAFLTIAIFSGIVFASIVVFLGIIYIFTPTKNLRVVQ